MVVLSRKAVVSREDLKRIGDVRLQEAQVLFESKHYVGAIYLAGYAVECYLKAAICASLDWDDLRGTFKTHDLEGLLLYSGFNRQLRSEPAVLESFDRLAKRWSGEEEEEPGGIRYVSPDRYDERKAKDFLKWVGDPQVGVVPWLQNRLG